MNELRAACAAVAERAQHVQIDRDTVALYAVSLPLDHAWPGLPGDIDTRWAAISGQDLAAFWLTLDAINFGSGWFPTLRKRQGHSGYYTIAAGVRERFEANGPWTAEELMQIDAAQIAAVLGQDPAHELMELFAGSLRDLGWQLSLRYGGRVAALIESAGGSAVTLAKKIGSWPSFSDSSRYDELMLPFLKRAQILASDLARAGVAEFGDLDRLTMFADNLVPHVLRVDGILQLDPDLIRRIGNGELIEHDSREEVEIRACALHAVELIVGARPGACAAQVDEVLWLRGQDRRYKASPRHRSRCTAY